MKPNSFSIGVITSIFFSKRYERGPRPLTLAAKRRIRLARTLRLAVFCILLLGLFARPSPVSAATYTVNSVNDVNDGTCNAAHCSLREAINAANASPGPDAINFNIPGTAPRVISASPMPALTDAGTTINGNTQPGYAGTPIIEVTGDGGESDPGFRVQAASITIRGLAITEWSPGGIIVEGAAVVGTLIEDNYIGVRTDGTTPLANGSVGGIGIFGGAASTQINDNVISANTEGILIDETCPGFCTSAPAAPSDILIENNKIGTNAAGSAALGNMDFGISVQNATDLTVQNNVISANGVSGISLDGVTNATIESNKIGTDLSGTIALGTAPAVAGIGISVFGPSTGVIIGGPAASQGNVISGNYSRGIDLLAPDVIVQNNLIGTDATGTASLPNGFTDVRIAGGADNSQVLNNVICGGVLVAGFGSGTVTGAVIQDNRIGTTADGTAALCTSEIGVTLSDGSSGIQVLDNLISGHSLYGVLIEFSSTDHVLHGNFIGTDASGTTAIGNGIGVMLTGSGVLNNSIGGPGPGEGNVISGNFTGISLDADPSGTLIRGNKIGTDASGTVALGNVIGIWVIGTTGTLIGGAGAGEGNLISGNTEAGIWMILGASGNQVLGNTIGLGTDGSALGNGPSGGVFVHGDNNQIGQIGAGNVIAENLGGGILLLEGTGNQIVGNIIGEDGAGNPAGNGDAASNTGPGISLMASDTFISENIIAHNGHAGLYFVDGDDNQIVQNQVYDNNATGVALAHQLYAGLPYGTGNTLSQNLIYDNGALGIDLMGFNPSVGYETFGVSLNDAGDGDSGPNNLLNYPELTSVTPLVAAGTACPNCIVELYLADDDPSGHGEGMEFITQVTADASGSFSVPLTGVGVCELITSTATDGGGNTSEFSPNVEAGSCIGVPPLILVLTAIVLTIGGAATGGILGYGRQRPVLWHVVAGTLFGGALAGGALLAVAVLPNMRVRVPASPVPASASLPLCDAYLDAASLSPALGNVLEPGGNPVLAWGVRGGLLEGQIRWIVEVAGPGDVRGEQTTTGHATEFSALGLDPSATGFYLWRLSGERAETGSDLWQPFCGKSTGLYFQIAGPPLGDSEPPLAGPQAAPATPTSTPTSTLPPTLVPVTIPPQSPTSTFTPQPPQDDEGPGIKGVSDAPDPIYASAPKGCTPTASTISAAISDPSGVQSAVVIYVGTSAGSVDMNNTGGNQWQAQLGPFDAPGAVNYQIRTFDNLGNRSDTQFFTLTVNACIP